jgi:hypothetical protein
MGPIGKSLRLHKQDSRRTDVGREDTLEEIRVAMREGDAERVFRHWTRLQLEEHELTVDLVPASASWDWPSLVQGFALLFDGYAWAESNGKDLFAVLAAVEDSSRSGQLGSHSIAELRAALFALQRLHRDSTEQPRPELVVAVLDALRSAVLTMRRAHPGTAQRR